MGYNLSDTSPLLEIGELAEVLGTNPRRVEGWVEQGILKPAVEGDGPGRRRQFGRKELLQGALLLKLQGIFGKRSPVASAVVRAFAPERQKPEVQKTMERRWQDTAVDGSRPEEGNESDLLLCVVHGPQREPTLYLDRPEKLRAASEQALHHGHIVSMFDLGWVIADARVRLERFLDHGPYPSRRGRRG